MGNAENRRSADLCPQKIPVKRGDSSRPSQRIQSRHIKDWIRGRPAQKFAAHRAQSRVKNHARNAGDGTNFCSQQRSIGGKTRRKKTTTMAGLLPEPRPPCRVQPGLSLCVFPRYHPSVVFHVDSKRHRSLRVFSFFPVLLTATTNTKLFECCRCTGSHLQICCLNRHHCVWHYLISPAAGPASTFSELTTGTLPTSS